MKYWEIIADNVSKAGWSWGCVSAVDSRGQTIFVADAHRDGQRFVVRADGKLDLGTDLFPRMPVEWVAGPPHDGGGQPRLTRFSKRPRGAGRHRKAFSKARRECDSRMLSPTRNSYCQCTRRAFFARR
jgi:hypothetical protein